jgi:hypothetical protein
MAVPDVQNLIESKRFKQSAYRYYSERFTFHKKEMEHCEQRMLALRAELGGLPETPEPPWDTEK